MCELIAKITQGVELFVKPLSLFSDELHAQSPLIGELRQFNERRIHESSTKVSFCLLDTLQPYLELPGSPATGQYLPDCTELDPQGISVGWADIYSSFLPGQSLDLTGLRRGAYCLRSTVDPKNHLQELDNSNNSAEHRFFLHPRKRIITPEEGICPG